MNKREVDLVKRISALCEQLVAESATAATEEGTPTRPGGSRRHRLTQVELAALPPVLDANGVELVPGIKVKCPDGVRGRVERVDRKSKRAVVERNDGLVKMVTAHKLAVTSKVAAAA